MKYRPTTSVEVLSTFLASMERFGVIQDFRHQLAGDLQGAFAEIERLRGFFHDPGEPDGGWEAFRGANGEWRVDNLPGAVDGIREAWSWRAAANHYEWATGRKIKYESPS